LLTWCTFYYLLTGFFLHDGWMENSHLLHPHLTVFPVFVRLGILYWLNAEYAPPLCEK
jgi:hypothetical protein